MCVCACVCVCVCGLCEFVLVRINRLSLTSVPYPLCPIA